MSDAVGVAAMCRGLPTSIDLAHSLGSPSRVCTAFFVFNSRQQRHNESLPSRPTDLRLCALRLRIGSTRAGDDAARLGEQSGPELHALYLFISGAAGADFSDF